MCKDTLSWQLKESIYRKEISGKQSRICLPDCFVALVGCVSNKAIFPPIQSVAINNIVHFKNPNIYILFCF